MWVWEPRDNQLRIDEGENKESSHEQPAISKPASDLLSAV
jgi:hypothetical protein